MWLIGPKEPVAFERSPTTRQDFLGGGRGNLGVGVRGRPVGPRGSGSGQDEAGKAESVTEGRAAVLQGASAHLGQPWAPGQGLGQRAEGRGRRAEVCPGQVYGLGVFICSCCFLQAPLEALAVEAVCTHSDFPETRGRSRPSPHRSWSVPSRAGGEGLVLSRVACPGFSRGPRPRLCVRSP